ncbi:MAG: P-loop NTPase [Firmicutes bacterium]|nr:P-loop NTPase [Bacillota bacterium]
MSFFHCPVGASSKGTEECISCGMCTALTREEQKKAADIVRAYLRSNVSKRLSRYVIKKIAVCGKGGAGKSTVAAMMAIALRDMGYEVLVIDTDESNSGLHRKLGIDDLPKPLLSFIDRFNDGVAEDSSWLDKDSLKIEDIPETFITTNNRLSFMMAGKIEDAMQGCACSASDLLKLLLSKIEVDDRQIVIIDNEAGVESFGRGLELYVDTVITVVEPSFESIGMAGTIKYMAEGLGISRIRAILNKVTSDKIEKVMIGKLLEQEVKYLGVMRLDDDINVAGLLGEVVSECDAKSSFESIVRIMLDEAEMKYNAI